MLQKFVSFKSTASFHVESCHFARSATYLHPISSFFSPLLPFLQFFLENTSSFPSLFRSFLRNSLFPFNLYFFSPSFVPCLYKCLFFSTMTSFTTFLSRFISIFVSNRNFCLSDYHTDSFAIFSISFNCYIIPPFRIFSLLLSGVCCFFSYKDIIPRLRSCERRAGVRHACMKIRNTYTHTYAHIYTDIYTHRHRHT